MFAKKHIISVLMSSAISVSLIPCAHSKFTVLYPTDKDTLVAGRSVDCLWTGDPAYNVSIYVTTDGGINWETVATGVNSDHWSWAVPFYENLDIQVKIVNSYTVPPHLLWEIPGAHNAEVRSVAFSPGDNYIMSVSSLPEIKLWDTQTSQLIKSFDLSGDVNTVYQACFYGNTDTVLVAANGAVLVVSVPGNTVTAIMDDSVKNVVRAVAGSPGKHAVAAASNTGPGIDDGIVAVLDINSGKRIADFRNDDLSQIRCVSFSHDGSRLIFGDYNGRLNVVNPENGSRLAEMNGHGDNGLSRLIYSCSYSGDGSLAVSAGGDMTVRVWDMAKEAEIAKMGSHSSQVWKAVFHPSLNWVLSASLDSMLIQWDCVNGSLQGSPLNHGGEVLSAGYSSDGSLFVSGGRNNAVRLWKNFGTFTDSAIVKPTALYPATVSIPDIVCYTGDVIRFPVVVSIPSEVPQSKLSDLEYKCRFDFPVRCLEVRSPDGDQVIQQPRDTVGHSAVLTGQAESRYYYKARVLNSQVESDTLTIVYFDFINSDEFLVTKDDGKIVVLNRCQALNGRSFQIGSRFSAALCPNPCAGKLKVGIECPESGPLHWRLADASGKEIETGEIKRNNSNGEMLELDVGGIIPGKYFLSVESANMLISSPLIIIR